MAQSIRNIVTSINASLNTVFKGIKTYGITYSVEREGKTQPVSNEVAVTFDDSYAMQVYHKVNGASITYKPGMGRQDNTVDTFQMSAYIFNNERITKLKPDEIAMIFQSVLSLTNIISVRVLPVNIILNSQAIFNTEYRGSTYPLDENNSLLQINYNVEVTFKSGCFDLCPEDFSPCKNN